jgi:hypothetical protein
VLPASLMVPFGLVPFSLLVSEAVAAPPAALVVVPQAATRPMPASPIRNAAAGLRRPRRRVPTLSVNDRGGPVSPPRGEVHPMTTQRSLGVERA